MQSAGKATGVFGLSLSALHWIVGVSAEALAVLVPAIIALVVMAVLVVVWFQLAVVVQSTILWIGWPILGVITILQTLGMFVKLLRRHRGYKV